MVTVIFYEKPGCINNSKQKALLQAAGHDVVAHNLLTEAWTRDRLCQFFGDRPLVEWFNPTAPQIKTGEVNPTQLDADMALSLMLKHPLLIRRPLLQIGDRYEVGFNTILLEHLIGLQPILPTSEPMDQTLINQALETCPRSHLLTSSLALSP